MTVGGAISVVAWELKWAEKKLRNILMLSTLTSVIPGRTKICDIDKKKKAIADSTWLNKVIYMCMLIDSLPGFWLHFIK